MGAALLRISKLQDKWRVKLAKALEAKHSVRTGPIKSRFKLWCEKYAMFVLPFITVLREGLEAVVFIGGVGLGLPATSFPLAVLCGLACGCVVGFFIYKLVPQSLEVHHADKNQGWPLRADPVFPDLVDMLSLPGCSWSVLQIGLEF